MKQRFINLIEQLVTECQYRLNSVKDYDACDIEFELPHSQDRHEFFTLLEEKFAENNLVYKIDEVQKYSTVTYYYLLVKRRKKQLDESIVTVLNESMTYAEFSRRFETDNNFRAQLAQAVIDVIPEAPVGPDGYTLFTQNDIDEWEY